MNTHFLTLAAYGLFLLLPASRLFAQLEWESVNDGIWGADASDMVITETGRPLITTTHGLYLYESEPNEELGFYSWKRLEKRLLLADLEASPNGRIFARPLSTVLSMKGLYFSDDEGYTWEKAGSIELLKYVVFSDSVIAGLPVDNSGFFVSRNAGQSWENLSTKVRQLSDTSSRLIIGADNNLYLYKPAEAFWDAFHFLYSKDSGRTWSSGDSPFPLLNMVVNEAGIIIAVSEEGIYRSVDAGKTWWRSDTIRTEFIVRSSDGTLYASRHIHPAEWGTRMAIFRSTDEGLSWQPVSRCVPKMMTVGLHGDLWINSREYMLYSTDRGASWSNHSSGLTNVEVVKLIQGDNVTLYALVARKSWLGSGRKFNKSSHRVYYTLYRSVNSGLKWEIAADSVMNFLAADSSSGIYIVRDSLYIDTVDSGTSGVQIRMKVDHVLYRSSDRGKNWHSVPFALSPGSYDDAEPFLPFAVVSNVQGDIVVSGLLTDTFSREVYNQSLYSTDSGYTWRTLDVGSAVHDSTVVKVIGVPESGTVLFTTSPAGAVAGTVPLVPESLWKTRFYGGTPSRLIDSIRIYSTATDERGYVYMVLKRFPDLYIEVYRSTDGGDSWKSVLNGTRMQGQIYEVQTRADVIFVRANGVFRSVDQGMHWDTLASYYSDHDGAKPLPRAVGYQGMAVAYEHLDTRNPDYDISFYHRHALVWSSDNGDTWQTGKDDIEFKHTNVMMFDRRNRIFAGTAQDGVFRTESTLAVPSPALLTSERGLRVFPVPSTDHATIQLHLAHKCRARIEICSSPGRLIEVVAEGTFEAGEHRFPVPVEELPSGAYFCRLLLDGRVETVPLIIQR